MPQFLRMYLLIREMIYFFIKLKRREEITYLSLISQYFYWKYNKFRPMLWSDLEFFEILSTQILTVSWKIQNESPTVKIAKSQTPHRHVSACEQKAIQIKLVRPRSQKEGNSLVHSEAQPIVLPSLQNDEAVLLDVLAEQASRTVARNLHDLRGTAHEQHQGTAAKQRKKITFIPTLSCQFGFWGSSWIDLKSKSVVYWLRAWSEKRKKVYFNRTEWENNLRLFANTSFARN